MEWGGLEGRHRDRHVGLLRRVGQRHRRRPYLTAAITLLLALVTGEGLWAQTGTASPPSFVAFANLFEVPGLVRYNRVEAVSVGTQMTFGAKGWLGDLTLRLGSADRRPNATLGLRRRTSIGEVFLHGSVGLRGTQPFDEPLGVENSVGALLTGRDLGEYLREEGAALGLRAHDGTWSVALRAVHEEPAAVRPHRVWSLLRHEGLSQPSGTGIERPVVVIRQSPRTGIEGSLSPVWGRDPSRASLRVRAKGFWYGNHGGMVVRHVLRVPLSRGGGRSARPLVSLSLQQEWGAVSNGAPPQDRRTVGGWWSLRGWEPASLSGSRWAIGRAEINLNLTHATVGGFFDAAAVDGPGSASAVGPSRASSAGVGLAFLDGVLRVDFARRLGQTAGFQVEGGLALGW